MKIILISGQSGSGKSHFSQEIKKVYNNSLILKTDDFYRSGIIKRLLSSIIPGYYDRLISIKIRKLNNIIRSIIKGGGKIKSYKYDFNTKKSSSYEFNLNSNEIDFLIIEGIFSFRIAKNLFKIIDYKFICDVPKAKCLERRIKRDTSIRGRNKNEVLRRFDSAYKIFEKELKKFDSNSYIIIDTNSEINNKLFIKSLID